VFSGFSKAAEELQPAFLNPRGEFLFILNFQASLEKPVRIPAGGFKKASCFREISVNSKAFW
jgi:hypothetical protein